MKFLKFLRKLFRLKIGKSVTVYHDLDSLAGTWTSEDRKEFESSQQGFRKTDRDLWI
jgi:hypothetical protein